MRPLALTILAAVVAAGGAFAQAPPPPPDLNRLLDKAERATRHYTQTFKNLSAEETKIFEDYDKGGRVKETRRIKSVFIVYHSPRAGVGGGVGEFRNVLEFNGKGVARKDAEVARFFEKIAGAASGAEEWKKIRNEASRFDGRGGAWGITLTQVAPLGRLRPFFSFQFAGAEKIENREAVVIEYRQTEVTPLIQANSTEEELRKEPRAIQFINPVSDAFRPTNPRLAGKIWLDAETGQIWRNEFKLILHPPALSGPVVSEELAFEYQPSEFKILVPKRFVLTVHKITGSSDRNLSVSKDRRMIFEYSKFASVKTEIQKYEVSQ